MPIPSDAQPEPDPSPSFTEGQIDLLKELTRSDDVRQPVLKGSLAGNYSVEFLNERNQTVVVAGSRLPAGFGKPAPLPPARIGNGAAKP